MWRAAPCSKPQRSGAGPPRSMLGLTTPRRALAMPCQLAVTGVMRSSTRGETGALPARMRGSDRRLRVGRHDSRRGSLGPEFGSDRRGGMPARRNRRRNGRCCSFRRGTPHGWRSFRTFDDSVLRFRPLKGTGSRMETGIVLPALSLSFRGFLPDQAAQAVENRLSTETDFPNRIARRRVRFRGDAGADAPAWSSGGLSVRLCCGVWRSRGRTICGAPTPPASRYGEGSCPWWRSRTGRAAMFRPGGYSNTLDAGFCAEAPEEALARRRSSTPTGHQLGASTMPASASRWTASAGAWTPSSPRGCGARSNTRRTANRWYTDDAPGRRPIWTDPSPAMMTLATRDK